ncbi:type II toxin-antitoxin system PemK/MazF family toxin [Allosaccharopolyspora coralli]|uniref:type II toxin-antitoxin system PemK/MazF family toxin n=1 Tax=Allosaccharopolyspora coralli TaxID=2665642 RepID=UPI002B402CCA|nr:type II toxin-antitoxin system PemK/MazF family toxin [Allosaccharopolyspora coralli]
MIERANIYWSDLGAPQGSRPAQHRPVLIVQSDGLNASRLSTALAAVITSHTDLALKPGTVFLPSRATGLPRDSVVNVTALVTLDKDELREWVGILPLSLMREVDQGLRLTLDL